MALQERASADASSDFFYDGRGFLRNAIGREPAAAGVGIFCDDFESGDLSSWGGTGSICLESTQTGPLYDSAGLLHGVDGTQVLYFAGRPVAQFETESLYLTTNHLGTPIQATDSAMAISWEGGFEPFGADYSGAQAKKANATCETISDVDEKCVNRLLEIGKAQGPWSFGTNDCWAFARRVVYQCETRRDPPGPFLPPGGGIFPP